jgi:hypothetical protein
MYAKPQDQLRIIQKKGAKDFELRKLRKSIFTGKQGSPRHAK